MTTEPTVRTLEIAELLQQAAQRVDDSKAITSAESLALDNLVIDARDADMKYRDIATATGRSVAWVQAVLNRHSYPTKSLPERPEVTKDHDGD